MSDGTEQKEGASGRKPLTLTRTANAGTVRQSFSHGRTKQVTVEVREKRAIGRGAQATPAPGAPGPGVPPPIQRPKSAPAPAVVEAKGRPPTDGRGVEITDAEVRRREEAVRNAMAERDVREERARAEEEQRRALDDAQRRKAAEDAAQEAEMDALRRAEAGEPEPAAQTPTQGAAAAPAQRAAAPAAKEESDLLGDLGGRIKSARRPMAPPPVKPAKKGQPQRREGKLTLDMVERITEGDDDRVRSLAAYRRAQQKEKERRAKLMGGERERVDARSDHS